MRKLVLDTETTGLDPEKDRIIELACVEIVNDSPTGDKYHRYYNPGNIIISNEAEQIHGLNNKFLEKFPTFEKSAQEFIEFIKDSQLIIHNASFDLSMINTSLERVGKEVISSSRAICTLEMSRKMFPGSKNNLNALCRRFNISLESREKHGALTDCYLLQEVYIELLGGKQERLNLSQSQSSVNERFKIPKNFEAVSVKLSDEEKILHEELLKKINGSIWN
jgi:DNA polymerase-3 subunit epsilon|tara:strand:- start:408 stop:1073 length:666 start_codon:yes stop_codon:yes gene_type:complete